MFILLNLTNLKVVLWGLNVVYNTPLLRFQKTIFKDSMCSLRGSRSNVDVQFIQSSTEISIHVHWLCWVLSCGVLVLSTKIICTWHVHIVHAFVWHNWDNRVEIWEMIDVLTMTFLRKSITLTQGRNCHRSHYKFDLLFIPMVHTCMFNLVYGFFGGIAIAV